MGGDRSRASAATYDLLVAGGRVVDAARKLNAVADVAIFRSPDLGETGSVPVARGTRALSRTPHLDSFLVDRCTIEQKHSTVAVDGEVVKMDSPLTYELGRGALKLVVPEPGDDGAPARSSTI